MNTVVHFIGNGHAAIAPTTDLVGGKAANLIHLEQLGLPVPPALALETSVARHYRAHGGFPDGFRAQLERGLAQLESATGQALGDERPLLVAVRSSPPVSMPGMLDSILNVGLTEAGVSGLIRRTGNPWLAWDVYRRLVLAFAGTVHRCALSPFAKVAKAHLAAIEARSLEDLDPLSMRDLALASAELFATATGAPLPSAPIEQVLAAVEAVLRSWTAPRANEYRRLNHLDDESGTGVIIQAMVFGNSGPRSGSGVGFTRNPANGDNELYVDFVFNGQGEDVVSGRQSLDGSLPLSIALPEVWTALGIAKTQLERHFRDMQDFEFTVENGQLYFLQTRTGKRAPWAALRIAMAMVAAGILEPAEALDRLAAIDLGRIERVALHPAPGDLPIARATSASVGVATGAVVFDAARAQQAAAAGPVILVRTELAPDDIAGVSASVGLLTTFGGRTSHAAVIARQLGKVCLVGCSDLSVDPGARSCAMGARRLHEGATVTLDGDHGFVYAGSVRTIAERPEAELAVVAGWRHLTAEPAQVE